MLSPEQRSAYARDGFLVLRAQVPAARVAQVARWADELAHEAPHPGHVRHYDDDSARDRGVSLLSRVEYFAPFHNGMRELLRDELLIGPASELLGDVAVLFKDKINYKLPGSGGFELHQDLQAGWADYANDFVTLMLSIDECTPENGCLQLAAAQHTRGLLGPAWTPLAESVLRAPLIDYPTKPGDLVLFGPCTPHGSRKNLTDQPRRALFATYNARAQGDHYERYFADKREAYPPDIERAPGTQHRYRV